MRGKKVLMVLIAVITVLIFNVTVFADTLDEKQNEYDKSQQKVGDLKEQKKDIHEEIAEDQKRIAAIDSQISAVNGEINDMVKKIEGVQNKINVTTEELNAAIDEYNRQDELMKKRINALYKNGTSLGYIQVVLESTSFSDFITRADIMKKIVDYDINMLKEMKLKREEIDRKRVELEKDKSELLALKGNLDNKKRQLVGQKEERKVMVALLSRKLSTVESAIREQEALAAKIQKEIEALMNYDGNYDGSKYAVVRQSDLPSGRRARITSPYGYRIDPITGRRGAFHPAIDIGTGGLWNIPIYAMAPGKVIYSGWYGGYGYTLIIDHGSGLATRYSHNGKLLVKEGQMVLGGQKIALSGSTGRSTGPHLDFGVIKNGEHINPTPYVLIGN